MALFCFQAVPVSSHIAGIKSILCEFAHATLGNFRLCATCMSFCLTAVSFTRFRYCIVCKVCLDSWEGCNVSETAGWWLLHKVLSLHHDHSVLLFLLLLFHCNEIIIFHNNIVCSIMCVCVIQGKGVPDVNSRLMVRKLWDTLHIPIFALVDADPHGTNHLSQCKLVTYFA